MPTSERELLQLFRIKPIPEETLHLLLQVVLTLILLFIAIQIFLHLFRKNKEMKKAWAWFYKMCEAKDLSINEMKILRDLALLNNLKFNPGKLLDSITEFDRAVIKKFREPGISDYERDKLAMEISELRKKLMFDYLPPDEILRTTHGIEKGQRLRIEAADGAHLHYYTTSVFNNSEKALMVYMPVIPGHDSMLETGQELELYFWRHRDAGYRLKTKIIEISKGTPLLLHLAHTDKIEREQKRHFYRIDITLLLKYHRLTKEDITAWETNNVFLFDRDTETQEAKVIGLSGGGLKFSANASLEKGDLLWMELQLTQGKRISPIVGRIIRVKKINETISRFSVEFTFISEQHRETIIRSIAVEQRRRIKM